MQPVKTLAIQIQFNQDDVELAFLLLKKNGASEGQTIENFCQGEPTVVNMSAEMPEEAAQMCLGMMCIMVAAKMK